MLLPNELDEQISLSFNVIYSSLFGVNEIVDIKKRRDINVLKIILNARYFKVLVYILLLT